MSAEAGKSTVRGWKPGPTKQSPGRIQAFFLSNLGRTWVRGAALATASGIWIGYVSLNTWFMDQYRDAIQHYEHGMPVKVSEELKSHAKNVMDDIEIKERFQKAVRYFFMYGFEPFSIGSLKTKYGMMVGFPKYFEYKTTTDVDKRLIQIEQQPVAWESEEGTLLKNSLVLSDNAKKFAIAQQIYMGNTNYVYFHATIHSMPILLYTVLTTEANKVFYGLFKPLAFRVVCVYSLAGLFSYGVWSVTRDLYNKSLENFGDKKSAELGIDYAKGGSEYFSKVLQRNIAQRALMGPNGEKMYTQLGNHKEMIRQKHVPLTDRKSNCDKQVEKYLTEELSSNDAKVINNDDNKNVND